jgi:tripartite-type tricarboxylate transporter receptor subunit TctC
MKRESTLGRGLWVALVILLTGYVVADFARSPFVASRGSAAVRGSEITFWTSAQGAVDETTRVVDDAAAALELHGHTTSVKTVAGGSSAAVGEFLSRPPTDNGVNLLVVSSSTVADLAHDRRDRLVPGAAEDAALARELLRRATPVGLLESDPLVIGVDPASPIDDPAQLLEALRAAPSERLFGIADDTWSRVQLASLVNRAGVDGHVRFSVFQSGGEAGQAVQSGQANTVLAPRGALREDIRSGRLRGLGWPFSQRPPRFWVALVAPPGLPRSRAVALRRWVDGLRHDSRWREQLRRSGRQPGGPDRAQLTKLLDSTASADRLEQLAQQVESR